MSVAFVLPIYADPTANLNTIAIVPTTITLDGLIHYWDPETAVLSDASRVVSLTPWRGTQKLIQNTEATAPTIETIGGKKFVKFEKSRNTRVITGVTPPTAVVMEGDLTAGFTLSIVAKTTSPSLSNGLLNICGFRPYIKSPGTTLQIQKYWNAGATLNVTNFTVPSLSNLSVITISFNRTTYSLKVYINGVFISENIDVKWNEMAWASSAVFGSEYNIAGDALDGNIGVIAVHNRVLTPEEVLFTANGIKAISGI